MKTKLFYFVCFFSTVSFAQKSTELKIDINSIVDIDSLSFKKYTVQYSISNTTNNKISFFLNPERVFAGSGGSKRTDVSATLYQENEELPMHIILSSTSKSREFPIGFENLKEGKAKDSIAKKYFKEVLNIDIDDEMDESLKDPDYFLKKSSERLMKSIMTLEPLET